MSDDLTPTYKEQLTQGRAIRRHWEVIVEDHKKHLSDAMMAVHTAQLELENVVLKFDQAPSKLKECDMRMKQLECIVRKDTVDPKVRRILNMRAKLAVLEAEMEA